MDRLTVIFGRRVRALRRAKGMTQEQLGRAVKLDPKYVGSIERGEKGVSFEAVERFAAALGAEFYELFLPDKLTTGKLEAVLRPLVRDVGKVDPAAVQKFFADLLAAVRRLDGARES